MVCCSGYKYIDAMVIEYLVGVIKMMKKFILSFIIGLVAMLLRSDKKAE